MRKYVKIQIRSYDAMCCSERCRFRKLPQGSATRPVFCTLFNEKLSWWNSVLTHRCDQCKEREI